MSSSARLPRVALVATWLLSLYGIWGLFVMNGAGDMLDAIMGSKITPPLLPGTSFPLKMSFTGIKPIDSQLAFLALNFWPMVDGSLPTLSLFTFMFAGQAMAMVILVMIEGARYGNRGKIAAHVNVLAFLAQNVTLACALPLYLLLHLSTSPAANQADASRGAKILSVDRTRIGIILVSVATCFGLPTLLMSLPAPGLVSLDFKQNMMALWQVFPITIAVFELVLSMLAPLLGLGESTNPDSGASGIPTIGYATAFVIAAVSRIAGLTTIVLNTLFPVLFSPQYRDVFSIRSVLVPAAITPSYKPASIGWAGLLLVQYDELCAGLALVIWAGHLYLRATASRSMSLLAWLQLAITVSVVWLTSGFVGVAVLALWARDRAVQQREDVSEKKAN